MNTDFNRLLNQFASRCPTQKRGDTTVFLVKDHPVMFQAGEIFDVNWVDVHIELPRIRADNISMAKKLLSANKLVGATSAIPSWFACGDNGEVLFVNRIDWRHVAVEVLEDHIVSCIDQMSEALSAKAA